MPIYMRTSGYKIYVWSKEPEEPVHFHITKGDPAENDTKVWVLQDGTLKLAHNKGRIPQTKLSRIFAAIQPFAFDYIIFWKNHFGYVKFQSK